MKMTKDQFIKVMSQIQNFQSQQETINQLIDKITDGFAIVDVGNYLIDELIKMISLNLEITDEDLLFWWLYEDVNKTIHVDDKSIKVETLDELWDYIQNYN